MEARVQIMHEDIVPIIGVRRHEVVGEGLELDASAVPAD